MTNGAYYSYKKQYPLNSGWLVGAGILSFLGGVLVLISFSSPYWLASYESTYSQFVRLGLWETCFRNYRHPDYQFDKAYNGCRYIFGNEYQIIRAWLLPEWLMFVQAMVSISLISSLFGLIVVSVLLTRFLLFMEILMITMCLLLSVATAVPMLLAVSVFGGKAFDRDWLQYPTWNYLSWAYVLAVLSVFLFILAALCYHKELRLARDRRRRANNLVFNMQRY